MRAFQNIRTEMRENAIALTRISAKPEPVEPAQIERGRREAEAEDDSPIDDWMQEAFEALVTACLTREPFMLLPCTVNGEPTAAIVHVSHTDRRQRTHVTPLFVAMTPGMVLIDQKGRRAGDSGEGGGDEGDGSAREEELDSPAPG